MVEYYIISDLDYTNKHYKTKAGFIRGIRARMKYCHVRLRYFWQARTWEAVCYPEDKGFRTAGWQGVITGKYDGVACSWMYQCRGAYEWDCARV